MKPRTIAGVLLLFSGFACYGAGGFILSEMLDRNGVAADQARRSEVACREQIVRLGRITPRENNAVEIEITDVSDPRSALADATAALAMCPGRSIIEACIGTMCGTAPGPIRMVIKLGAGT